jgi:bla regulator protein blaR1
LTHTWRISGRYELTAVGITMPELSYLLLSTEAQRLVVDGTGLKGRYDFSLRWTREDPTTENSSSDASAPSIFTALPEQLGLKLVPIVTSTKVFVLEHIDRPTEN